jgi:hypothetical protein
VGDKPTMVQKQASSALVQASPMMVVSRRRCR